MTPEEFKKMLGPVKRPRTVAEDNHGVLVVLTRNGPDFHDRNFQDDERRNEKIGYKVNDQFVKTNLELRPQKLPLRRAQGMFCRAFKEAQGDESKIKSIHGALHISLLTEVGRLGQRQLAARCTRESEGLVRKTIQRLSNTSVETEKTLCETLLRDY